MKLIWTVKKPIKGANTIQWIGLIGIIWWIIEIAWDASNLDFPKWYIIVPSVIFYIIGMIMGAGRKKEREQSTFVYCGCKNEMISDEPSFVRDIYLGNRNVVHYKCSKCGKESFWNFDLPVPISYPFHEGDTTIEDYRKQYSNEL